MRTCSQSRNSNRQQQQVNPTFVDSFNLVELILVVTMDDTRTMAQLLEAPTVGYEDVIAVPEITADNFELKHGLLTLPEFGLKKNPFDQFSHGMILFQNSSTPFETTNLQNEIMRFQQRFDETFFEAWDRFNDLLRACPHHGFSELHQLDTFYNALNSNDQDSLNSAVGGNFLDKMPRDCLRIIESKSKVRNSRNKPVVAKVSSSSSTPGISPDVAELKDMVKALLLDKKSQAPTPVKAFEESCVTCGVMRNMQDQNQNLQNQMTNLTDMLSKFLNSNTASTSSSGTLPSNTITNPKWNRNIEVTKDTVLLTNNGSTKDVQPLVVQVQPQIPNSKPVVTPVSAPMPNLKPPIPYPSRRNNERRREKSNDQIEKFYEIFKDLSFKISLTDALILMPKFASTLKALIGNKEKLSEMARTPLNEHCSAVVLNKLPEKLRDPDKFLIPCDFLSQTLSLPELTPTCMTLELQTVIDTQPTDMSEEVTKNRNVPLIDVYEGELTLRVGQEALIFKSRSTSRYYSNYDDMTANRIDVIEMACEEYS
ncbi:reverse transcriptase domain-containing protein [Tanacetum coccineum]|uniref:Reverse transcriptase domain-containing protein n=1 Tax=Tanacetum coccineum TaxID=301880 RepID=A0ABQ5HF65_9ASTR